MARKERKPEFSEETKRIFDLSKYDLNDTDRKVLLLKLDNVKQVDIAKKLKRKETHICDICKKPEFKKAYEELTAEIERPLIQTLIEARTEAVKRYTGLIHSRNESIAARVCENLIQFDKINLDNNGEESNGLIFEGWNDNNPG